MDNFERFILTCCTIVVMILGVFFGVLTYWLIVSPEKFFGG